jgi:hypothetical protein
MSLFKYKLIVVSVILIAPWRDPEEPSSSSSSIVKGLVFVGGSLHDKYTKYREFCDPDYFLEPYIRIYNNGRLGPLAYDLYPGFYRMDDDIFRGIKNPYICINGP